MPSTPAISESKDYPWRRALLWMLTLGLLFLVGYRAANDYAEAHSVLTAPRFAWEGAIPFIAWTVVPYLSLNIVFPLSFFLCERRSELDVHGLRLLTAQVASFGAFLLWPMHNMHRAPIDHGLASGFFEALLAFDKPYNMMPSLHLAVLVIVWDLIRKKIEAPWGWACHVGAVVIAISTLTTWQHHVLDVLAGTLLGALCIAVLRWPREATNA